MKFAPAEVELQDHSLVELLIFENFLRADKNRLDASEMIAYQIVLSRLEKDAMAQEPFEASQYKQMLKNGDYIKKFGRDGSRLPRAQRSAENDKI